MNYFEKYLDWAEDLEPMGVSVLMVFLFFTVHAVAACFAVFGAAFLVAEIPFVRHLATGALGAGALLLFWHVLYNQKPK